uniref:RNA helicase n=1 Tax=viral metagenome TaxID=1070528 RepID=A0A6C0LK84_9ZZZZ
MTDTMPSTTPKTSEDEDENNNIVVNENHPIEEWNDLEMNPEVLRGIYSYGFENPSPIQKKGIKPMLNKRDVIAQAQSGTGKTGCFTVGTLARIDPSKPGVQALILSPTRELSMQTKNVIDGIGTFVKGFKSQLLVGGTSTDETIKGLVENKPTVVVGCPGRVYDMLRRKKLHPNTLRLIILDEADEMLSSGFKEQIYNIFQFMPSEIQVGLFTATLPHDLMSLTEKFMRNPVKVLVKAEQLTLEGISQYYVGLDSDEQKYECLKDIFSSLSMAQCIIYCNSVRRVQDLYDAMTADNYPVAQIHSGMEKEDRSKSYKEFRAGTQRVLISSNVTARGIDVQQVSTVINFDLPKCVHTYLHRIGRSGRWGRKGVGINFITRRDSRKLKEIEQHYSTQITEMPLNWEQTLG